MKKISTVQAFSNEIFKGQKLTIGLDLGDRWSFYCVLDEAGKIILEQKIPTTTEGAWAVLIHSRERYATYDQLSRSCPEKYRADSSRCRSGQRSGLQNQS